MHQQKTCENISINIAPKILIGFDMNFSFENMIVSKKVNYLLRKYDLFIQEYDKVTPK